MAQQTECGRIGNLGFVESQRRQTKDKWQTLVAGPIRDWVTRLCGVATFSFLGLVTATRFHMVLGGYPDLSTTAIAQLFTALCQTTYFSLFVWFTLARKAPLKRGRGLEPRLSALLGTFLPLSFGLFPPSHVLSLADHFVAAALLLVGSALIAIILPRLGRSFSLMAEARELVTSGPYRVIRHPLYLAEEIAVLGAFIEVISPYAALLLAVQIAFQIRRIYNEEAVLKAVFPDYAAYCGSTARIIPGVW